MINSKNYILSNKKAPKIIKYSNFKVIAIQIKHIKTNNGRTGKTFEKV